MKKTFNKYNGKTRGLLELKLNDGTLRLNINHRHSKKSKEELKLMFEDIEEVLIENRFKVKG